VADFAAGAAAGASPGAFTADARTQPSTDAPPVVGAFTFANSPCSSTTSTFVRPWNVPRTLPSFEAESRMSTPLPTNPDRGVPEAADAAAGAAAGASFAAAAGLGEGSALTVGAFSTFAGSAAGGLVGCAEIGVGSPSADATRVSLLGV